MRTICRRRAHHVSGVSARQSCRPVADGDPCRHYAASVPEPRSVELANMTKRVLIIVHQEHSNPVGWASFWWSAGARSIDAAPTSAIRCRRTCPPTPRRSCSAGRRAPMTIICPASGPSWTGSSAPHCPPPTPLLGICLGAQMMARVLGARVGPHPDGLVEIGYHPVHPTAAGEAYFDGPTMFYQWHRDTFDIPAGAVHLAHNAPFAAQAFRYDGHAYGIEFHPEMTLAMIKRWTASRKGGADAHPARRADARDAARGLSRTHRRHRSLARAFAG